MTHVDLAIIGSGSGNMLPGRDLGTAGIDQVAIIEGGPVFGGTCLNVGCIPTKMFVRAADAAAEARDSARLGVDAVVERVRWADIRDRVFGRIDPFAVSGEEYRRTGKHTSLLRGHARFTAPLTLEVDLLDGGTEEVSADQIVIATGSHPHVPEIVRASGVPFHTSDTVMRLDEFPARMMIIGGGFIAAEMAHVFGSFGAQVSVIARSSRLLRHSDQDISAAFTAAAMEQWDVHLGCEILALRGGTEGEEITAVLSDGSEVSADVLLVATGRHPSSGDLGVQAAGVQCHPDGRVVVDEFGRTTAPGVWALGDVCSPLMLKHVANQQARTVAHNLAHPDDLRRFVLTAIPGAVFSHPQVAGVGLTERDARERGHDVVTHTQMYGSTAYGWALEDTTSFCKLIGDRRSGALLGAHLLGPEASTLIQPLIQTMALGTPLEEVARGQYWIHPALTEVVENALLGLIDALRAPKEN
ncbi:mycothione reductase [Janibacter sp. GXQ6167]|uniref:mycothione reductase n=1 Tax=Janibacter sp. GXQ6167 TaxID=3240791 RepID=UPI0035241BC8